MTLAFGSKQIPQTDKLTITISGWITMDLLYMMRTNGYAQQRYEMNPHSKVKYILFLVYKNINDIVGKKVDEGKFLC